MARFTLRQLELFAALPDHATLSTAAAALHISESGLSYAISELERAVGEQLCLRRKARGMQLTPAGRYFAERARAVVADADELASALASQRGELVGPVSVGCFTGFASTGAACRCSTGSPAPIRVWRSRITVGTDDELLPAVTAGRLDFAFVYEACSCPEGLAKRPIYRTEILAVLPPEHRLAGEESIDLADLADEPLIMLDTAPSATHTPQIFAERGLEPNTEVAVPSLRTASASSWRAGWATAC